MARVYATVAEARALSGLPLTDEAAAAHDLRRAARLIDRVLLSAVYPVDADGYPTDEALRELLRDLSAEQLVFWDETGDATGATVGGSGGSIGDVSLPGGNSAKPSPDDRQRARLSPDVADTLRSSELVRFRVAGY